MGASFFLDALSTSDDTTQLLSFTVDDVHAAHAMLSGNAVPAVDDVRQRSHGAIVFFNPAELDLIYADLCGALPGLGSDHPNTTVKSEDLCQRLLRLKRRKINTEEPQMNTD